MIDKRMPNAYNRDLVLVKLLQASAAGLTRREAACELDVSNLSSCIEALRDLDCDIAVRYVTHTDRWGRNRRDVVYALRAVGWKALRQAEQRTGLVLTP